MIYDKISSSHVSPNYQPFERGYSEEGEPVKDFLQGCLNKDPAYRYSAKQLLAHPWLKAMLSPDAPSVTPRELTDIGMTLYTFKRTSQF